MNGEGAHVSLSTQRSPRVTVVMIVRDGERFLEEALQSVCAQTMTDWEVVVIDDGSQDATRAIAQKFVDHDGQRFRLFQHDLGECRGMSASRNLGIAHARATLITFLDHDDAMLPHKLERQCALLDQHPHAAAVIGPNLRWFSWEVAQSHDQSTRRVAAAQADRVQDLGVQSSSDGTLFEPPSLLPIFLARTDATPQALMVRRDVVCAIHGFANEFRDMYEDQVFLAKLLLKEPVVISSEVWQRYRQHSESCVRRAHRARRQQHARRRYLTWLGEYVRCQLADERADDGRRAMLQAVQRSARREWWKSLAASMRSWLRIRR